MRFPKKEKDIIKVSLDLIEQCNVSLSMRAATYRVYGQWIETGRAAGGLGTANMLYAHLKRTSAHIFSPTELRFNVDYINKYEKRQLEQAEMTGRVITDEWQRNDIDMIFSGGADLSLNYGASILKQNVHTTLDSDDRQVFDHMSGRIVFPWQFGVLNEGRNGLEEQEAVCETVYLSQYEVWRRIQHLPNADKEYKRIIAHSH